jgi:hypothetical protein
MTFKDLHTQYTERELSSFPGDSQLRHEAFLPILSNLHQSRIVYRERMAVSVVLLSDFEIDAKGFRGHCMSEMIILESPIEMVNETFKEGWYFGGGWEDTRLIGNALNAPYAGWTIWPEKDVVRKVIELTEAGNLNGALALISRDD